MFKAQTQKDRSLESLVNACLAAVRPHSLLDSAMQNKLELDVHLILTKLKEMDSNALPHIEERLTKLETNQRWLIALSLLILSGTIAAVANSVIQSL
jgi:hypothetical protein